MRNCLFYLYQTTFCKVIFLLVNLYHDVYYELVILIIKINNLFYSFLKNFEFRFKKIRFLTFCYDSVNIYLFWELKSVCAIIVKIH